jgi:very-short-patch-repair endonuclease
MRGPNEFKTERARRLRQQSTDAERKLWWRLRSRGIHGHKFVRQEPIGRFVVDFVCRERKLIVEIDGGQHADNKPTPYVINGLPIADIGFCAFGITT